MGMSGEMTNYALINRNSQFIEIVYPWAAPHTALRPGQAGPEGYNPNID